MWYALMTTIAAAAMALGVAASFAQGVGEQPLRDCLQRAGGFIGLFAPAATPPAVVKKISVEVAEILKTPAVQANVKTLTATVAYEDDATFTSNLAAESARWKVVIKDLFK